MKFVESVRVGIESEEKILLLQKSKESNLPFGFELPGGKSDQDTPMNEGERIQLALKEVEEETGIKLNHSDLIKSDFEFEYTFKKGDQELGRKVFFFQVKLEKLPVVKINQTFNVNNKPEDNHLSFVWVDKSELNNFLLEKEISQNSLEFLKYLFLR